MSSPWPTVALPAHPHLQLRAGEDVRTGPVLAGPARHAQRHRHRVIQFDCAQLALVAAREVGEHMAGRHYVLGESLAEQRVSERALSTFSSSTRRVSP